MSTELITLIVAFALGGLISLVYISHSVDKQRREKALRVANLNDQAYRLQRLLDYIPPAFLHQDIRTLLLGQIKQRLGKALELAPANDKLKKKLETCNAQLDETQAAKATHPPVMIKSPDEANELRILLQDLSRTIESFVQNKALSTADAQRHLASIQNSFIEANLNYLIQTAQAARQDKKPKLAIHHLQKALAEMQKRNQNGQYNARMEQLKETITQLLVEADQPPPSQPTADGGELDAGINELAGEDESWKKKYF